VRLLGWLTVVAFAALAGAAHAGTPTRWERLTGLDDGVTYQVGLARTADGALHVAWLRTEPGNARSLHHTPISPAGRFGATTPIQSNWTFMANPDLLVEPGGGLRVLFGGQRTTVTGDPNTEMNTATADAAGAAWALQPFNAAEGAQAAADAGAVTAPDGVPLVSWGATAGVFVHRGTDPSAPDFDYQGALGGCCGYMPDLAVDGAGRAVVAWYSNAAGRVGVWAQAVDAATGGPAGAPMLMPGTADAPQMVTRMPIASRPGEPGVFVAYPAAGRVMVWEAGATAARTIVRDSDASHDTVGISSDPAGRLWMFWSEKAGTRYRIVARRSNLDANRYGERVVLRPPRGSVDDFHLDGSAQAGRLDLLGAFGRIDGTSTWHRQVLPGLTVRVRRVRGELRVTVTDAGVPVSGTTVRAGGDRARTNQQGRATLSPTRRRVVATKGGYTPGSA
jgi:hypothetical protein